MFGKVEFIMIETFVEICIEILLKQSTVLDVHLVHGFLIL